MALTSCPSIFLRYGTPRRLWQVLKALLSASLAVSLQAFTVITMATAQLQQSFPLATAEVGTWQPEYFAQGQIKARREAILSTPSPAVILSLPVATGERVIKDQLLAQLAIPGLQARLLAVQNALTQEALAKQRAQDAKHRFAEKLATQDELLQAEERLSQAGTTLNAAWQDLENALVPLGQSVAQGQLQQALKKQSPTALAQQLATLRAPFSGVIGQRSVTDGSRVAGGQPLLTLLDISRVRVNVSIPIKDLPEWQQGKAFVTLPGAGQVMLRRLTQTPPVNPDTGLAVMQFEADNPEGRWLDGEWLRVGLTGTPQSVVWVPEAAVVGRAGKTWCVRRQGNTYEPAEVQIGPTIEGRIPVISGLMAGEQVVTQGAYLLLYRDLKQLMKFED